MAGPPKIAGPRVTNPYPMHDARNLKLGRRRPCGARARAQEAINFVCV